MNHDVFISYSSKNPQVALAVCHLLEEHGIKCWMAPRNIPPGSDYGDLIDDAIKASKVFLFIYSFESVNSKWCRGELNIAFSEEKIIIPYRIDTTPIEGAMNVMLNQFHWLDAYPDYQSQFTSLVEAVNRSLGKSTNHTSVSTQGKPIRKKIDKGGNSYNERANQKAYNFDTLHYDNGHRYVGELRYGYPHGRGTLYFANGTRYVGEFKNGNLHGQGTFYFADGDRYEGEFKDGKYDGRGTLYHNDGTRYVGEFKNGNLHGQGTSYFADGDRYEGEYKDSKPDGRGTYYFADGDRYEGEFKDGKPHGRGTYYHNEGHRYEGEYKDGYSHGLGTYYYADGDCYEGEFKDGKHHGRGTYYCANGDIFNCLYNNGELIQQTKIR